MTDIFKLFPPYLAISTLIVVILPTFIAFGIRVTLHHHLYSNADKVKRLIKRNSQGVQPKIIESLKARFTEASRQLDTVNTGAMVDELYGEETFNFLGFDLRCDKWEYFCNILPNLLLAFGLLGTFLGITLNLTDISGLINLGSTDGGNLANQLQKPLESMGIAFITSLIGLICSSILTVVNFLFNTNIARAVFITSLEDYLDNILQPNIEGNSRLDKAVNRMVEQQEKFLTRFHDNVTRAVESSLGKVAKQIADGNKEAADLAKQVYERFTETAGTLSSGANEFHLATSAFKSEVEGLKVVLQQENFLNYATTLENCVHSFQNTIDTINSSNMVEYILQASNNLDSTGKNLDRTVDSLRNLSALIEATMNALERSQAEVIKINEQMQELDRESIDLQGQNYNATLAVNERLSLIHAQEIKNEEYSQQSLELNKALQENIKLIIERIDYSIENNTDHMNNLAEKLVKTITKEIERTNYVNQIIAEKTSKTSMHTLDLENNLQRIINILSASKDKPADRLPINNI